MCDLKTVKPKKQVVKRSWIVVENKRISWEKASSKEKMECCLK